MAAGCLKRTMLLQASQLTFLQLQHMTWTGLGNLLVTCATKWCMRLFTGCMHSHQQMIRAASVHLQQAAGSSPGALMAARRLMPWTPGATAAQTAPHLECDQLLQHSSP